MRGKNLSIRFVRSTFATDFEITITNIKNNYDNEEKILKTKEAFGNA